MSLATNVALRKGNGILSIPDLKSPRGIPISIQKFVSGKEFQWAAEPSDSKSFFVFWVISGTGCVTLGEHSEIIGPGEIVFLQQKSRPRWAREPESAFILTAPFELLRSSFVGSLFANVSHFLRCLELSEAYFRLSHHEQSEAEWLLARISTLAREPDGEDVWPSMHLYLGQFLLLCSRNWKLMDGSSFSSADNEKVIRTICDYIDQHYTEPINLKDLAKRTGYTPTYLSTLFSRIIGQPVTKYVNEKRIARACELLETTHQKVIFICYEVGFQELGHFYRVFKKLVGTSPDRYRKLGLSQTIKRCGHIYEETKRTSF